MCAAATIECSRTPVLWITQQYDDTVVFFGYRSYETKAVVRTKGVERVKPQGTS
jgi:hypothetical protein